MPPTWRVEQQRAAAAEQAREQARAQANAAWEERQKERNFRRMLRQQQVESLEQLYRRHGLKGKWPCPWYALFGQCVKGDKCSRPHQPVPASWLAAVAAAVPEAPAPVGPKAPKKASKAEPKTEAIEGPPLPTLDAFPVLPEPAPAMAPLDILRPVVHVVAERKSAREVAESETASVTTERSEATTIRARDCYYCKRPGHLIAGCPALEASRQEEAERALERLERQTDRAIERALRKHELETTGWWTVGNAALVPSESVCTKCVEPPCEGVEVAAEPAEVKKPSRARRQAAKRVAERELRAAAGLA